MIYFKAVNSRLTNISYDTYERHFADESVDARFNVTFRADDGLNYSLENCRVLSTERIENFNKSAGGYPPMVANLPIKCGEAFSRFSIKFHFPAIFVILVYNSEKEFDEERTVVVSAIQKL